jgi:hypothetical protein
MNLINGKIVGDSDAWETERDLYPGICETLSKQPLDADTVIAACDEFVSGLTFSEYADLFTELNISREAAEA